MSFFFFGPVFKIKENFNERMLFIICRDGLHLTLGGNKIVFEEVIGKLKEVGLSLETLPADLPFTDAMDPNDPLKVFED